MTSYICPRCTYTTKLLGDYKRHLDRASPCNDECNCGLSIQDIKQNLNLSKSYNKFSCAHCGKEFTGSYSRYNHLKRSKCAKSRKVGSQNMTINNNIHNTTNNTTNNINNTTNNNNNNTINNNNNVTNNINITINAFGEENISYMTRNKSKFIRLVYEIFSDPNSFSGLTRYAKSKHFDPEHKENGNLRLCPETGKIQMWNGRRWGMKFNSEHSTLAGVITGVCEDIQPVLKDDFTKSQLKAVDKFMQNVGTDLDFVFDDIDNKKCKTVFDRDEKIVGDRERELGERATRTWNDLLVEMRRLVAEYQEQLS